MQRILATTLLLIAQVGFAAENVSLPADVQSFIESRELCEHFRQEDPYDQQRREFLQKQIAKHCIGTDKALDALKEKYKDHGSVIEALSKYEVNIESH